MVAVTLSCEAHDSLGITIENRKLHLDRAIPASFAPNALTCHFIDAKDVCRDQESLRLY